MEELQRELFRTFLSFNRLHISRILPGINMGDFTILKTLRKLEDYSRGLSSDAKIKEGTVADAEKKSPWEGIGVSAIVEELDVPASSVSRSLRSLEEREYVVRYVNKKDRRNTYVEMTPEGEAILEESEQIISDFCNAVFRHVGEEDIHRLISYFTKFRDITEEEIQKRKYQKEQKGSDET